MESSLVRTLLAVGIALVMGLIASRTRDQPYRRSALGLGALGLLFLAAYNAIPDFGVAPYFAAALLFFAPIAYITSWLKGEFFKQQEQLRAKIIEEQKRRKEKAESSK